MVERKKGGKEKGENNFYETNNRENDNFIDKGKVGDEIINKFKIEGVSDSDLNSSLWSPYSLWAEKLVSLTEISEIENFKSQMFSAIEEAKKKKLQNGSDRKNIPSSNSNTPNSSLQNLSGKFSSSEWINENKWILGLLIIFFLLIFFRNPVKRFLFSFKRKKGN